MNLAVDGALANLAVNVELANFAVGGSLDSPPTRRRTEGEIIGSSMVRHGFKPEGAEKGHG